MTPAIARRLRLLQSERSGAYVVSVDPGGPGAKAGIKPGDVIIRGDGQRINSIHDLPSMVANAQIGTTLNLTIRRNGKRMTLTPVLAESAD